MLHYRLVVARVLLALYYPDVHVEFVDFLLGVPGRAFLFAVVPAGVHRLVYVLLARRIGGGIYIFFAKL